METCPGFLHLVEEGDTLYQLSKTYAVPLSAILLSNPYVNVYHLQVGDEICIPRRVMPRKVETVDK